MKGTAMNNPADLISQKEKREILAGDRQRKATTYRDHAQAFADEDRGGRFAVLDKPKVTGSAPVIQYPRLPGDNPSNQLAMTGEELPLGYSIEEMEPTGELHERNERSDAEPANDAVEAGPSVRLRRRRV